MEDELAHALRTRAARTQTGLDPDAVVNRARRRHRIRVAASSTAAAVVLFAVAVGVPLALLSGTEQDTLAGPVLNPPAGTAEPEPGGPARPPADGRGDAATAEQPPQPGATPEPERARGNEPTRGHDRAGGDAQHPAGATPSRPDAQPGTGGPYSGETKECGTTDYASNITATGVDCATARQIARAAPPDGQSYHVHGFSCGQPYRHKPGVFYLCVKGNDAKVTFGVPSGESSPPSPGGASATGEAGAGAR